MTIFTSTGAKFYIAPSQSTTPADATAYAALTWTEIKNVTDGGEYGDQASIVTAAVLGDGRMQKAKGSRDAGTMNLVVLPKAADAGQDALVTAEGTANTYPFKVVLPNRLTSGGTDGIDYFTGLVTSKRLSVGGNDNVIKQTFTIAIDSAVVTVDPT